MHQTLNALLTALNSHRLEAATSRLEDIASSSNGLDSNASTAPPTVAVTAAVTAAPGGWVPAAVLNPGALSAATPAAAAGGVPLNVGFAAAAPGGPFALFAGFVGGSTPGG